MQHVGCGIRLQGADKWHLRPFKASTVNTHLVKDSRNWPCKEAPPARPAVAATAQEKERRPFPLRGGVGPEAGTVDRHPCQGSVLSRTATAEDGRAAAALGEIVQQVCTAAVALAGSSKGIRSSLFRNSSLPSAKSYAVAWHFLLFYTMSSPQKSPLEMPPEKADSESPSEGQRQGTPTSEARPPNRISHQ